MSAPLLSLYFGQYYTATYAAILGQADKLAILKHVLQSDVLWLLQRSPRGLGHKERAREMTERVQKEM